MRREPPKIKECTRYPNFQLSVQKVRMCVAGAQVAITHNQSRCVLPLLSLKIADSGHFPQLHDAPVSKHMLNLAVVPTSVGGDVDACSFVEILLIDSPTLDYQYLNCIQNDSILFG